MTAAQTLARELVTIGQWLEPRLGVECIAGDLVRAEVERAGRTVAALASLVGLPPPAVQITAADLRREKHAGEACPGCGEPLKLIPTSGFGPSTRKVCGACGYDPQAK